MMRRGLFIVPVLTVLLAASAAAGPGRVVRDATLGAGRGAAVGAGFDDNGDFADYLITPDLGETRGANLFHSFAYFDVGTNEVATFTGPASIDHVIARVTGGSVSQIDGMLRSTIPSADLYLLNPSGVLFGPGAELEVDGSFHASTAGYLALGDSGERLYADPARASVLSVAPPSAWGFLGGGGGATASLAATGSLLEVPDGKTLSFVSRDAMALDGATLRVRNGRVNLAALGGSAGELALGSLDTSGFAQLGDVSLANASLVDASGDAPGGVFIRGGQVVVAGSKVLAQSRGAPSGNAGGLIDVLARDALDVDGGLLSVSTDSAGDAGTIALRGGDLVFRNGPGTWNFWPLADVETPVEIAVGASAETTGGGAGGGLEIDARSLRLLDGAVLGVGTIGAAASGDAGVIDIAASSVEVTNHSVIDASSGWSRGDAGTVSLDVDTLTLDGNGSGDTLTGIFTVATNVGGPGGALPTAPGTVEIDASGHVSIREASIRNWCGFCSTRVADRAPRSGLVSIRAGSLTADVRGGVAVGSALGGGDAGRIEVFVTGVLELRNGGNLIAEGIAGGHSAGSILVRADTVWLRNGGRFSVSALPGSLGTREDGFVGTIDVRARSFRLESGSSIDASSKGSDHAGRITVEADSVSVGGAITAGTLGSGKAGSIEVSARDSILLSNRGGEPFDLERTLNGEQQPVGIFSSTAGGGDGGVVRLQAPRITVTDGAIVATSTIGGGAGGSVALRGDRIRVVNGGFIDTTSGILTPPDGSVRHGGDAGDIKLIATESIEISGRDPNPEFEELGLAAPRSRVASASFSDSAAGSVRLRAPAIRIDDEATVATIAVPTLIGDAGPGGTISLFGDEIRVRGGALVEASAFGGGTGGSIDVYARESIVVEGVGTTLASRTGGAADGGSVSLHAPSVAVARGATVSARSAPGLGETGDIFGGIAKDLAPPARAEGDAGSVAIDTRYLRVERAAVTVSSEETNGGDITVTARDRVHLVAGVIEADVSNGKGGDIAIDPTFVILQDGSRIQATALEGQGGNIQITADNFFAFPGSVIDASSRFGLDGLVAIHTPDTTLAGTLATLPASYLDASSQLAERCSARASGGRAGSFMVRGTGGVPADPDGWLAAPLAELALAPGPSPLHGAVGPGAAERSASAALPVAQAASSCR